MQEQEGILASQVGGGDTSALKKQVQNLKQAKMQNENKILELSQQLENAQQILKTKQKELEQSQKKQSACCILF